MIGKQPGEEFRGSIISISGVDGCGKTAIIGELRSLLADAGVSTKYVWLRYNHYTSKAVLGFCRLIGLTRYEETAGVRVGYHDFHKSRIISIVFIGLTYVDTFFASLVRVFVPAFLGRSVVICDRWILDIMVDLEVDTGFEFDQRSGLGKIFMNLPRRRCHYFVIDRDEAEARAARKENALDANFTRRVALYRRHAADPRIETIVNNRSIHDAAVRIISRIDRS